MVADVLSSLNVYSALGWSLFPCASSDKRPLTPHGFKDASADPGQWERWYHQHPGCLWGTPTSSSEARVDIDPRNGGEESWDALIREHGDLPPTPMVETGSRGRHYLLKFPDGTACRKIGPGIDLKASGGYVIVPPSRCTDPNHVQPYRWMVKPWEVEVATAPEWLVELANKPKPKGVPSVMPSGSRSGTGVASGVAPASASGSAWVVGHDADLRTHPGVPEGSRRVTLCRLVGAHLGRGDSPKAVRLWERTG
ncbi:MAG: bifunctional DNA primase/polymerase [Bacteroidales bacterium]|nr:bifunctional DNA primase/polymerase [Bacteroidales bacterium]